MICSRNILCAVFVAWMLLCSLFASAQVRADYGVSDSSRDQIVQVSVYDSLSRDFLPGATVFLIFGKDTVKTVTGAKGDVFYLKPAARADTLCIKTSFVGYKTRNDRFPIAPGQSVNVYVPMTEDPMQLASIVVTADAVAMIVRGDTTVFNAAAFPQMEGDALRDMLAKFPGVEIDENEIRYNGKKIDRLLVNGANLFGKDIGNAMDIVLSREVKSVKVYDKTAVDDLHQDSALAKEHVMDVHTWKPLEKAGSISFSAEGGVYSSERENGRPEYLADGTAGFSNYTLASRPRINLQLSGGHNNRYASSPVDNLDAVLTLGKDTNGKGGYEFMLQLLDNSQKSFNTSVSTFFPSELWNERRDSSFSAKTHIKRCVNFSGNGYMPIGKDMLRITGRLSFINTANTGRQFMSSVRDAFPTGFDKVQGDSVNTGSLALSADWTHRFANKRRTLSVRAAVNAAFGKGRGARIDTLGQSMAREWLASSLRKNSLSPSLTVSYNEPLGKKSAFGVNMTSGYNRSTDRNLFLNVFTSGLDLHNSKDFTSNDINISAMMFYRYGRKNDGFFLQVNAGVRDILTMRDEHLDNVQDMNKNYIRPIVRAEADYSKGAGMFMFVYEESESVPDARQLRNTVDDTNPMFLYAGNPGLSLPVNRKVSMSYSCSFPEKGLTMKVSADGEAGFGTIANRITYFDTQTSLDEYGYIAPAGSSLTVPVNVSGRWNMGLGFNVERYFTKTDSKVAADVRWAAGRNLYYLADGLMANLGNDIFLSSSFEKYGSKYTLSITPGLVLGRTAGWEQTFDHLDLSLCTNYRQRIGKHFEFVANVMGFRTFSNFKAANTYDLDISCNVSWMFGPDNRYWFRLFGMNLTDSFRGYSSIVLDNQVTTSHFTGLGRCIGISFGYTFNRR